MTVIAGTTFGARFANFNVIQANYKTVGDHNIRADFLVPKSLTEKGSGKRPVIVRFHGGGLVVSDSLYPDWFQLWLLELADEYGAVIVSANYRYLPEVTGLQILDDVEDFWTWLHSEAPKNLLKSQEPPIEIDLDRVISTGDSAGGLLSVYLTLSHPDEIRAGTAAYPSLYWDDPPIFPPKRSELIPEIPESVVDEYLANLTPDQVESSDYYHKRGHLESAISQHKRGYGLWLRDSETAPDRQRLYQLARLDNPEAKLPPGGLAIIHGADDDVVLVEASHRFVNKARKVLKGKQGADKVVLTLRPGGHGFDADSSWKEEWLKEALKTVVETWLE